MLSGRGLLFTNTVNSAFRLQLFLAQLHIRAAVLNADTFL